MNVKLINTTPMALELLLYTKNTRLQGAQTLNDILNWPERKKLEHLAYMRDTIKSSWEFVNYVFEINDVTRAFTHQLVRTRTGSYAQESQRTVDVRDNGYLVPEFANQNALEDYCDSMETSVTFYEKMVDLGAPVQDVRGVLPTNMHTNIIVKFDLRTLHQMAEVRLCTRTQGEYQNVFKAMRDEVIKVHPWAEDFIQVFCANHGTCCFPRYTECPIQDFTFGDTILDEVKKDIKDAFHKTDHEAVPVANDGRTM